MRRPAAASTRALRAIALAVLLALAACMPAAAPDRALVAGKGAEAIFSRTRPQVAYPAGVGTLHLTIHWPVRPAERGAASIPLSTETIVLTVSKDAAAIHTETISRPAGEATSSATIQLQAASNLSLLAEAFREPAPLPEGAQAVARATAAGVNIQASKRTLVPIVLQSLVVPAIGRLSANAGKWGELITLEGTNLGMVGDATPAVTFGGVAATAVNPVDDTKLEVVVPTGAVVGDVRVSSDGYMSGGTAVFWVLNAINLDYQFKEGQGAITEDMPGDTLLVTLLYENTVLLSAAPAWESPDITPFGTPPAPVWSSSEPDSGTVGPSGVFVATRRSVRTDVSATIGSVSATIGFLPVGIDRVTIDPSSLELNARSGGEQPDARFLTQATLSATVAHSFPEGYTVQGVDWSTSDQTLVAVNSAGVITAGNDVAKGTVEITATSKDDPTVKATASVQVTIYGDLALEVD